MVEQKQKTEQRRDEGGRTTHPSKTKGQACHIRRRHSCHPDASCTTARTSTCYNLKCCRRRGRAQTSPTIETDSTAALAVQCKQVHLLASAAYKSSITAKVSGVLRPPEVPGLWISDDIASCMRAELPWQFPMKHRLANGKKK